MERARVRITAGFALVAAVFLGSAPASPQSLLTSTVRVQGVWMSFPDRAVDTAVARSQTHVEFDSAAGAMVGVEIREEASRWGLEVGAESVPLAATATNTMYFGSGPTVAVEHVHFRFQPLTAALDFHLRPGRTVDLFFGPTLSLISFSGNAVDNTDAIGAVFGLDVAPGSGPWAFTASARYLQIPLRGRILDNRTHIDAFLVGAGLAYRF